jgi:head-tail adaptor
MRFGPNSAKVAILRRPAIEGAPGGVARGAYEVVFETWASWRYLAGREMVEAGIAQDAIDLAMRVQASGRNRSITAADRLTFESQDYDIVTVAPRDRLGGFIELTVRRHKGG